MAEQQEILLLRDWKAAIWERPTDAKVGDAVPVHFSAHGCEGWGWGLMWLVMDQRSRNPKKWKPVWTNFPEALQPRQTSAIISPAQEKRALNEEVTDVSDQSRD